MPYGQVLVDTVKDSLNNVLAPASAVFRNRLFDAGFIINQRGYVSGTALSASAYAHDRWKAGASGCTYTFTQLSTGVPIVITITAGSLQQVIEGCNMPEGGTYTLSWTGTAQARFNGGAYGASPLAVTGITAGANTTIEFNAGTVSYPQLEVGTNATSFDYRPYGTELALCQRYCQVITNGTALNGTATGGASAYRMKLNQVVSLRASPTTTFSGMLVQVPGITGSSLASVGTTYFASGLVEYDVTTSASYGSSIGQTAICYSSSGTFVVSSEL